MPILSGAKLAAELGVSPPMITKYKGAGRIREEPGGGYDLDKVRAQLANTLGSKRGGVARRGDQRQGQRAEPKPPDRAIESPRPEQRHGHDDREPERGSKADLEKQALAERIRRERLRNDREERLLVDRAEVEAATDARCRADAQALLNWPAGVAANLAADLGVEERRVYEALDKQVRLFMRERSMVADPD